MNNTTTTARPGAVALDTLPLHVQARHPRRSEPSLAVAYDLTRPDTGMPCARLFFDASVRPARGPGSLDPETAAALRQWAAMIDENRRVIGGGR